jgi:hypothetical protein
MKQRRRPPGSDEPVDLGTRNMNALSTFLYARPSFVEGLSRILDFGDTLQEYHQSENGEAADYLALHADWLVVGIDLQCAMLCTALPPAEPSASKRPS